MSSCMLCRNGNFYFRIRVPKSAFDLFHRREIVISLKTRDRSQALLRCAEKIVEHRYVFSYQDNRKVATMAKSDWLDRLSSFKSVETTTPNGNRTRDNSIDREALDLLVKAGLNGDQIVEVAKAIYGGHSAPVAEATSDPSVTPITVSDFVSEYRKHLEQKHRAKKSSKRDPATGKPVLTGWLVDRTYTLKFRRFEELFGVTTLVQNITHKNATAARDELCELPAASGDTRGQTVRDAVKSIQAKDGNGYVKVKNRVVNEHTALYSTMLDFAKRKNYYPNPLVNPFEGLTLPLDKKQAKKSKRLGFTFDANKDDDGSDSELARIFRHDFFTAYATGNIVPGCKKVYMQPSDYWTPLIALHTGARPCEIGGLLLDDIRTVSGIPVFDFNEDGPGKCSKSYNAIRRTPIHSRLIDLGFLTYVAQLKSKNETRLFPELSYKDQSGYGNVFSERFVTHVLKPSKIYKPDIKVFYSFRHTVTTALRNNNVDNLLREQVCGRDDGLKKSVGEEDYTNRDTLKTLRAAVEKLDFIIELQHVQRWK